MNSMHVLGRNGLLRAFRGRLWYGGCLRGFCLVLGGELLLDLGGDGSQ